MTWVVFAKYLSCLQACLPWPSLTCSGLAFPVYFLVVSLLSVGFPFLVIFLVCRACLPCWRLHTRGNRVQPLRSERLTQAAPKRAPIAAFFKEGGRVRDPNRVELGCSLNFFLELPRQGCAVDQEVALDLVKRAARPAVPRPDRAPLRVGHGVLGVHEGGRLPTQTGVGRSEKHLGPGAGGQECSAAQGEVCHVCPHAVAVAAVEEEAHAHAPLLHGVLARVDKAVGKAGKAHGLFSVDKCAWRKQGG